MLRLPAARKPSEPEAPRAAKLGTMEQPWSEEQARWIVRRAATLSQLGAEPVGPLVLPDARFFPDRFDRTPESVGKLFERLRAHVGLEEVDADVVIVDPEEGKVVSSCSSGGCGSGVKTMSGERVREAGGGYAVAVLTTEVGHATVLTTALSRAVGQIFLRETEGLARFGKAERAAAGDLAACMLGLAPLVANGSAIEVKGCGGVKIHSATGLGAAEAALALALVVERQALRKTGELPSGFERGLDAVVRGLYPMAKAFVEENRDVIRRVDDAPASVEKGEFSLREPGSSFSAKLRRLFGGGKSASDDPLEALEREAALAAASGGAKPASAKRPASGRNLDEIRALVDESFDSR